MKVLIIGGTGFIGPKVVRHLTNMGHHVTLYNRGKSEADLPEGIPRITGQRSEISQHRDEFRALAPDVALDMFALTQSDARTVLDALRGIVPRIVAISSMDVYRIYARLIGTEPGPTETLPITEDSPLREKLYPYRADPPRAEDAPDRWQDDYDKILVERVYMDEPGMPNTVLRLPMVYGPGTRRDTEYIRRMLDDRPAILMSEGLTGWHPPRGYVEDVALGIALAVTDPAAAGRVYNICEADALPMREWVNQMARATGWHGRVVVRPEESLPEALRAGIAPEHQWLVNGDRIRRELGYAERVPREEALRRTVEWERTHPPKDAFDYAVEDDLLRET